MVRLYPFKTLLPTQRAKDTADSGQPNRFRPQEYDRSVFEGDQCLKSTECSCMKCSKMPVVVVSPINERMCQDHEITLRNAKEFVDGSLLETLRESCFLIYAQTRGSHKQVAICAAVSVEDCQDAIIRRHEKVTKQPRSPVNRRAVKPTNVDPVMIMYRDRAAIDEIVERVMATESPIAESHHRDADASATHKVWVMSEQDVIAVETAFDELVDVMYIADGHHRTAAACRFAARHQRLGNYKAQQHTRFLMGLMFPQSHLQVIAYNRCISQLGSLSCVDFLRQVSTQFHVRCVKRRSLSSSHAMPSESPGIRHVHYHTQSVYNREHVSPSLRIVIPTEDEIVPFESCSYSTPDRKMACHTYVDAADDCVIVIDMYIDGSWYELTTIDRIPRDSRCPVRSLGVQVLLDLILSPILGVESPADERMIYVSGADGVSGLEDIVDSGVARVAFAVPRVSIDDIMRTADAGQLLPPKATYFDPKPLSGFLVRLH